MVIPTNGYPQDVFMEKQYFGLKISAFVCQQKIVDILLPFLYENCIGGY